MYRGRTAMPAVGPAWPLVWTVTGVCGQLVAMRPSCCRTDTPSSRPTSSVIRRSSILRTVVPVNRIVLPLLASAKRAERQIGHRVAGVRAAAGPLPDDVVAFSDQVRGAAEREVRDCGAELGREVTDCVAPALREYSKRMSSAASSSITSAL